MVHASVETYSVSPERLSVGEVFVVSEETVRDVKGREYTRKEVLVGDESDADPGLKAWYLHQGNTFEDYLLANPGVHDTNIGNGSVTIPEDNEAARWLYLDQNNQDTQMMEWAERFPTAIALEPLQRLAEGGAWLSGGKLDERTQELFTNMVDGIGLRSRARIYTQYLVDRAARKNEMSTDIISLGSGAAVPNIQATQRLEQQDRSVNWRFYDFDPEALRFAQALIEQSKFQYSTFDYGPMAENEKTGVLEPKGQNYLRAFGVEDESLDVVDALGLWEYLKPEQATRFVSKLYAKLKPGGSLVVSNMTPNRPQCAFNQRAVGWPGLYLRDETALLDIVEAAGIDTSLVTMTIPEDAVYIVMTLEKPEC